MSLMVCQHCFTAYAPADGCPQCGGDVYRFSWEEEPMPKITVDGGASAYNDENPAPVDAKEARNRVRAAAKDLIALDPTAEVTIKRGTTDEASKPKPAADK